MRFNPRGTSTIRVALFLAAVSSLAIPAFAGLNLTPADVITIGQASGVSASQVDVPVFVQDVANTDLGTDKPAGSKIQAFSIKVNYAPAVDVQSVTFSRAGITASKTPALEVSPSSPGSISLLEQFDETTNLLPFITDAPAPGQEVAHLVFQLAPSLPPGTVITLSLDASLTQLNNQAGDDAETVANSGLALVPGSITVGAPTPTLSVVGLSLLVLLLGLVGVRFAARSL